MKQDQVYGMNIGIAVSGVISGASIGFLAASASPWIFVALLVPIVITGFAVDNFYKIGYIRGQINENARQKRSWGEFESFIDELSLQGGTDEGSNSR